eukprot:8191549-Pyramimonas_sp.AAC.1
MARAVRVESAGRGMRLAAPSCRRWPFQGNPTRNANVTCSYMSSIVFHIIDRCANFAGGQEIRDSSLTSVLDARRYARLHHGPAKLARRWRGGTRHRRGSGHP